MKLEDIDKAVKLRNSAAVLKQFTQTDELSKISNTYWLFDLIESIGFENLKPLALARLRDVMKEISEL